MLGLSTSSAIWLIIRHPKSIIAFRFENVRSNSDRFSISLLLDTSLGQSERPLENPPREFLELSFLFRVIFREINSL